MQLFKGDCLEILKEIPDKSVDFILCDPPFGTTNNEWDKTLDHNVMWRELKRVRKPNAAVALFSQLPFSLDLIIPNRSEFRYEIIWHKTMAVGFLNANRMPLRAHENILVFYDSLPTYNPQKTKGKPYTKLASATHSSANYNPVKRLGTVNAGDRYPTDVLRIGIDKVVHHPTQKPVALLSNLIKTYTNEGETVLDFTMGSGSTGVACVRTKREFIGIEQDPKFFRIAKQRIMQAKANPQIEEEEDESDSLQECS